MGKTQKSVVINGVLTGETPEGFLETNRAFRLGDGFFETIRIIDGKPFGWDAHYKRLSAACRALKMELPSYLDKSLLLKSVFELIHHSGITRGGRLRITVFRSGGGAYTPLSNSASYIAEVEEFFPNRFCISEHGASVGTFTDLVKSPGKFSRYKVMGNYISILAGAWAQENNLTEALILNPSGNIAETTSGNIFIVKSGAVHTPPVDDGGVGGVMRMHVLNACVTAGIDCYETSLQESDLIDADEIFITNSMKGIMWVGSFRHKRFYHKLSDRILNILNERIDLVSSY